MAEQIEDWGSWRALTGLTVEQMGQLFGVSKRTAAAWISGRHGARPKHHQDATAWLDGRLYIARDADGGNPRFTADPEEGDRLIVAPPRGGPSALDRVLGLLGQLDAREMRRVWEVVREKCDPGSQKTYRGVDPLHGNGRIDRMLDLNIKRTGHDTTPLEDRKKIEVLFDSDRLRKLDDWCGARGYRRAVVLRALVDVLLGAEGGDNDSSG